MVFSQATVTIPNSATCSGALYIYKPSTWYSLQGGPTYIEIGNISGPNGGQRGRGFIKFDFSNVPAAAFDFIKDTELVFNCGYAPNGNQTVKMSVSPKSYVDANAQTAWNDLGGGIFVDNVDLTNAASGIRKKINNKVVTDNRANNLLPLCLVHTDEVNSGIIVTKADLVITYYTVPSAPTNVNKTFVATESKIITTISWSASATGPATGYTVYYRKQITSTTWSAWSNVSVSAPDLSAIINLDPSSTYECYVRSTNVAGGNNSQTITFLTPAAPSISGASEVCYSASTFSLNNGPSGTIYWSVTGNFSFNSSSNVTTSTAVQPTLYRMIGSPVGGSLIARTGSASGTIIASKNITACVTSITGPNDIATGCTGQYNLVNAPAAQTIYWTVSNIALFSVVSSNCPTTVTKLGTGSGSATLSARVGSTSGTEIATKTITAPAAPVISGTPTLVCYKSAAPYYSFSANNFGSGYEWGSSSNLSIKSGQGTNSVSVNAASSGSSGDGWVSVKSNCGVELARYNLCVGAPSISSISGPTSVSPGSYNYYQANCNSLSVPNPSYFYWTLNEAGVGYTYQTTSSGYAGFSFYNSGYYQVICQASNVCGTGGTTAIGVFAGRSTASKYIVYPNPVSDILYIEIPTSENNSSKTASPTYDVRLYDGQGNLLRQQKTKDGTIQFNVSKLLDGLYYLHIYDGVSEKPEIQQIEVAH